MNIRSILIGAAALFGCSSCFASGNPQKITPEQGLSLLTGSEPYILVDVRRPDEYETSHIPGAILIPNETITNSRPSLLPDPDAVIIVYCRTGHRSGIAAKKLVKMGYTHILDLGGIVNWPYKTVSGSNPGKF
jgi:rhodanese-related sulfurtransferase